MPLTLQQHFCLKSRNSFGVEAHAAWFAQVSDLEGLRAVQADPRLRVLPRLVLGRGSNLLFTADFDGLVLQPALRGIVHLGHETDAHLVHVAAGEDWAALVDSLVHSGHPGLENLALIPGSAGAAPIQNIGAYGLELAQRLHAVQVWDPLEDSVRDYPVDACKLGYRDSVFKREAAGQIILGLTLRLPRPWVAVTDYAELARALAPRAAQRAAPLEVFQAVCALRRRKLPDPSHLGNAGSFFKNPIVSRARHAELVARHPTMVSYPLADGQYKLGAAWMIEACGLRGATRGRVGVHAAQALVLVNRGGAQGSEILQLACEVRERVFERFGLVLEPEVQIVGSSQRPWPALVGAGAAPAQ